MKEAIVIKAVLYGSANRYISECTENDVLVDQAENAKHFSTKQAAEDYLEKFPVLADKKELKFNAYTIETIFIV